MKLSVYLLICGGIMIFSPQINGDVVVDLFGKIQESAQKLGDDIKVVFQSNNKRNQQYKYEAVKESKPAGEGADKNIVSSPVTSTQSPGTSEKGEKKSNGTEQDGRENFRGSCATGYERTPDGRCKPIF